MADVALPRAARRPRVELQTVAYTVVLGLVAVVVLYPLLLVLLNSLQAVGPTRSLTWTLESWRIVLSDATMLSALWNTITLTAVQQAIALPIAILLAWVLARTDVPGAHRLEFLFWIAFFLPALPVTLGWILLLDPEFGLINQLMAALPFVGRHPFNIYSFWGIVWVHLVHSAIAVKVILLTPAFRYLDTSLEEASRVSGASTIGTMVRVAVPIMTPVLLVVSLLSIIHSLQSFEVEAILGPPFGLFIFSTKVYRLINQEPPLFGAATALSSIVLGLMVPLIVLQRWLTGRRNYATVGGQYRAGKVQLRRWRIPVFVMVVASAVVVTVVPSVSLLVETFMKLFGFFNIPHPWTRAHWRQVFQDPIFLVSLRNTLILAMGTALVAVVVLTLIAYIAVRTRYPARAALDFLSWLPSTLPGIVLGLGLLGLFLGTPLFRPLYGTLFTLMIATVISTMTLGVQIIKSSLVQFGFELEEAARVGGGSWWDTWRHVLLPLLTPVLLLVGAVSFISAARNVSTIALLATGSTRPLSLLQLDYMVEGRYEPAAVVGVVVVLLTTGIALIARALGLRVGIR